MTSKQSTETLASDPWLCKLPVAAQAQLLKKASIRKYRAGQRIHGKSEPADGLYGVLSGEVRFSAATYSGEEIAFTRLTPGQWFGEVALLDGGTRTHDAHAITKTELAILPKSTLLRLTREIPEVYQALVLLLCNHCRQAFNALDDFLTLTPEQRLAKRLLSLASPDGSSTITLSQEELGALVGVSRQSTNKILKTWEARGWIQRGYRSLDITAAKALAKFVES